MRKIVLTAPNLKSRGLKALANKLSEKVGYKVFRVRPERVRRRQAVEFMGGVDKREQFINFRRVGINSPTFVISACDLSGIESERIVARSLTNASEGR